MAISRRSFEQSHITRFSKYLTTATRRWLKDRTGATIVLYAVLAVPLLAFVGVAVDYSRLHSARVELQNALDAAGLAGARAYENTIGSPATRQAAAVQAANDFFEANFPDEFQDITDPLLTVTPSVETVRVSATATMPTTFMQVVGTEVMNVAATTTVIRSGRGVELALVMDNTGSMRGRIRGETVNKMDSMKAAAATLVNILYGEQEEIDNFYVSLVPYAAMVNVGDNRTGWVNNSAELEGANNGKTVSQLFTGTGWKGCVMARAGEDGGGDMDTSDAPPSARRWDVMSWPSTKDELFYDKNGNLLEVDPNRRDNRFEKEPIRGDNHWPPINEANNAQNNGTGPNLGCPGAISSLMQPKTAVLEAIDDMQPWHRGGTMSNLGLAWGWRTISPHWRGLWGGQTPGNFPLDYTEPNWEKVVIMLTDGTNQWYDWPGNSTTSEPSGTPRTPRNGLPGRSRFSHSSRAQVDADDVPEGADYTAYGRVDSGYLTDQTYSWGLYRGLLDDKMENVCNAMLDEGIIIFTITFGVGDAGTRGLFERCAGRPDRYFNSPTNDDLLAAFIAIATEINNLRISK